jgi:hypothetical protein
MYFGAGVAQSVEQQERNRGSILGRGKIFLFVTASRPTLGSTWSPIQWIPAVKQPGRYAFLFQTSF